MSSGWLVLSSLGTCGSPAKCFHGGAAVETDGFALGLG